MARSKSEQKSFNTSIRMTEEQHQTFKMRAKELGVKPGTYIVQAAYHANEVNPTTLIKIQDIVNLAIEVTKKYEPERTEEIRKKGEELWSL